MAVEAILQHCREGRHELITSDALRFENSRNPNAERRQRAEVILTLAANDLLHSAEVEELAQKWQEAGVELLDALHLASAELAEADRFATCDDVLINRASRHCSKIKVLTLLDLFKELAA